MRCPQSYQKSLDQEQLSWDHIFTITKTSGIADKMLEARQNLLWYNTEGSSGCFFFTLYKQKGWKFEIQHWPFRNTSTSQGQVRNRDQARCVPPQKTQEDLFSECNSTWRLCFCNQPYCCAERPQERLCMQNEHRGRCCVHVVFSFLAPLVDSMFWFYPLISNSRDFPKITYSTWKKEEETFLGRTVVRGGVRGRKCHCFHNPDPTLGDFLITVAGVCPILQQRKERTQTLKSLKPATWPSQSSRRVVQSLIQDATIWDQPQSQVWWAQRQWHSSVIQTSVSKHQHFNAVTKSQAQWGTQFGKPARKTRNAWKPARLHRQLTKKTMQRVTCCGTGWVWASIHELEGIKATVPSKDNLNNSETAKPPKTPGLKLKKIPELFPMQFRHHMPRGK